MDAPTRLVSAADRRAILMVADGAGQRLGQLLHLLEILVGGPRRDHRPVGASPGSPPHAGTGDTRRGRTSVAPKQSRPGESSGRPGLQEEHTLPGRRRCRRQRGCRMIRRRPSPRDHDNLHRPPAVGRVRRTGSRACSAAGHANASTEDEAAARSSYRTPPLRDDHTARPDPLELDPEFHATIRRPIQPDQPPPPITLPLGDLPAQRLNRRLELSHPGARASPLLGQEVPHPARAPCKPHGEPGSATRGEREVAAASGPDLPSPDRNVTGPSVRGHDAARSAPADPVQERHRPPPLPRPGASGGRDGSSTGRRQTQAARRPRA